MDLENLCQIIRAAEYSIPLLPGGLGFYSIMKKDYVLGGVLLGASVFFGVWALYKTWEDRNYRRNDSQSVDTIIESKKAEKPKEEVAEATK